MPSSAVRYECPVSSLSLLAVAALLLGYGLIAKRLSQSVISAAMYFLAGGLLIGPSVLNWLDAPATSATIEVLAEFTLALVLFSDASRLKLSSLRHQAAVPIRLLAFGLPLTIVAGTIGAVLLLPELLIAEAVVLAVILAPTDAALGQAVVSDERLPMRIRQALNVESGLNDGICVPLLVIALAWADAETNALSTSESLQVAAEAIGYGVLAGVAVGALAAYALRAAQRAQWSGGSWEQIVTFAAAVGAYAMADGWGGSGFIAAFVGGLTFGGIFKDHDSVARFLEEAGSLTNAITFIVLGALLVFPLMDEVDVAALAYVIASLTVIRMVPVAIALIGSGARAPTVAFLGWFGPRGLASLVFVVAVIDRGGLPHSEVIVTTALATVLFSVFAHGVTALPLTRRYATWYSARRVPPDMESRPTATHRWRWQPHAAPKNPI